MKTLFLIRHAKSSWANDGQPDHDRPLNERGLRDAPFMADLLKKTGIRPDLILSSTANRAQTTARFFAKTFGVVIENDNFQLNRAIYEAWPQDIYNLVQQFDNSASVVFLFGHNSTITDVANHFSKKFIDNVPTCGIVRIEGAVEEWADFSPLNAAVTATWFPKNYLPDSHD